MPAKLEQPGEVGLLAELAPALERIDHVAAMLRPPTPGSRAGPGRAPAFLSQMRFPTRAALAALLAALALCLLGAADGRRRRPAAARREDLLRHQRHRRLRRLRRTSASCCNKHPALIESFRTWGSDFPESIERWQDARARPVLHITTADNNDGHELITPQAIAQGYGDEYLLRLNKLFWAKKMRAYIRPLGEPNRCINVYASYDCAGNAARRGPPAPLVQARLPPHLHPRPRRRQAGEDRRRAWPKPACRR